MNNSSFNQTVQRIRKLPHTVQVLETKINTQSEQLENIAQKVDELQIELHELKLEIPFIIDYSVQTSQQDFALFTDAHGRKFLCPNLHDFVSFSKMRQVMDDTRMVHFLKSIVSKNDIVFDVGAHIGGLTIEAGTLLKGGAGTVHAFEAQSLNYRLLAENVALNDLGDVIQVNNKAIFSSNGTKKLNVFDIATGWHTLGYFDLDNRHPIRQEEIDTITIDSYCVNHDIEHIRLIKIDVEGAEPDVLDGMKTVLQTSSVDYILFEVSKIPLEGMGYSIGDILNRIPVQYDLYDIKTDGTLTTVQESDIQSAVFGNYVAKLRS